MSEILSQDQIDALLNQGLDNGAGADIAASVQESAQAGGCDYPTLQAVFEIFCKQAGSVVSSVINNKFALKIQRCEKSTQEQIRKILPQDLLSLTINFTAGPAESIILLISKKETAKLADMMMMGDGNAEYTDDHKDAICELINQVMGSFCTALAGKCNITVASSIPAAKELNLSAAAIDFADSDMVTFTMDIGEQKNLPLCIVIPREVSTWISKNCKAAVDVSESQSETISASNRDLDSSDLKELSSINIDSSESAGFEDSAFRESLAPQISSAASPNIEMLLDIELDVTIELGRTNLSIKRILELAPDAVIELDRLAGEPVDLLVNDKVIAKGEVVVVDENFGIRIVSLVSPEERIKSLR